MLGVILVPMCLLLVWFATNRSGEAPRILRIFLVAYVVRMLALLIVRDVQFFSHIAGGDSIGYELLANMVSEYWTANGYTYVTVDELPIIGPTTLPVNLFALIIHLNGGPTRAGCTAVIAMMACLTCLNFLRLARDLGADGRVAERVMTVILFLPSFTLYTSDMFKDGLVVFLVIGAVGSAMRLARQFSLFHLVFGFLCLWAVWGVRYYLVFLCVSPVIVGFAGLGSRSVVRPVLVFIGGATAAYWILSFTNVYENAMQTANDAFEFAYGWRAQLSNHNGGSGIAFDDGGNASGALPEKLAYTLLAPFPWMSGSFGMNVGKIDTIIFYYFLYRAAVAGKRLLKVDKSLFFTFMTFLIPMTLMYAMTLSNLGLVLRQRMPIMIVTMLMATLSWPRKEAEAEAVAVAEAEVDEAPVPALAANPIPDEAE